MASSIGIWIYNVRPDQVTEHDLLTGHTRDVTALVFLRMVQFCYGRYGKFVPYLSEVSKVFWEDN